MRNWEPTQLRTGWGVAPITSQKASLNPKKNKITLNNVRRGRYRAANDYSVRWDTLTVDLEDLIGADFILTRFGSLTAPGHVMVSFAFKNTSELGASTKQSIQRIVISAEIRRERGEHFSIIKGLFRNYELMYVFGDEPDLIKLRTNIHQDKTYLFPVHADIERIRSYFLSMIDRANALRTKPEFYNTLLNSCSTNLAKHLADIGSHEVAHHFRVMLAGHSAKLAYQLGLLGTSSSYEALESTHLINPDGPITSPDDKFSTAIRLTSRQ